MPDAKSSTVVVQRGVYTVARKTVDTEGNTIRETPPQWREDITGGSVIVCPINSETDEPLCDAELFSALSQDVLLDSLGKALGFHWPNFAAIFEKMRESEVDLPVLRRGPAKVYALPLQFLQQLVCTPAEWRAGEPETPTQPPVIWCGL